ncbi:3-oxoacyl-[acyl-carrier-protein] synthase I, chloroplastic [Dendrobium catenatum]|uniref:beta-ketoacyl-[acyl-carrier-protein] synthase I n=1 Tax=Dendrobium catenatum TaxID=906689 RepID=A0A2I0VUL2_9ASPA|nr:3-oxoacyl-[acyl-carrier-protein] synthase I, chloroplastic [Dendrobium catenatum]
MIGSKEIALKGSGNAPSSTWGGFLIKKLSRRSTFSSSSTKLQRITVMNGSPTVSAPKREKDPKKRIVISGMGLVSVFGNDVDGFYDKLLRGTNGVGMIDRFNTSELAVKFAGQIHEFLSEGYVDQKSDRRLDDCWRYCLVAGNKALESANLGPQQLINVSSKWTDREWSSGGSRSGRLHNLLHQDGENDQKEDIISCAHSLSPVLITNMGSALLAIDNGLMGPAIQYLLHVLQPIVLLSPPLIHKKGRR